MDITLNNANFEEITSLRHKIKCSFPVDDDATFTTFTPQTIKQWLAESGVEIVFSDFGCSSEKVASVFCEIEKKCFIFVNKNIQEMDGNTQEKYIKYLCLHEIYHMIHLGVGIIVAPDQNQNTISAQSLKLDLLIRSHVQYYANERDQEMAAELFAARLGFAPLPRFIKLFKITEASMRDIADLYKMPLDCAIKWSVILFHGLIEMHYGRWECRDNENWELVDWYSSPGHVSKEFLKSLVVNKNSRAYVALSDKNDSRGCGSVDDKNFYCGAYYRKKEHGISGKADILLDLGFVQETFDAFCY